MMKIAGAKKQTVFLTGINALVRAMGLLMRVILSRMLGAEVMGIMELAQSVHMTAIAPLTSGLPQAISRLTAKSAPDDQEKPLLAGLNLARRASFIMIPALWLFSPMISHWMCDMRVLPSICFSAPCIRILGYSASFNGYCYGIGRSDLPALSELIEQTVRIVATIALVLSFPFLTAAWTAAVPTAATMLAEIIGLLFVIHSLPKDRCHSSAYLTYQKPILLLALPTTLTRLMQTLIRSATAILIPLQLQASGFSNSEATSQLGLLNGMVMPILMLPCVFTSALSMVILPRIAKAEENKQELRRLLCISLFSCIPLSALCASAIYAAAPFLAHSVYRQAELCTLFQFCAPLSILFAFGHLSGSILSGLGQQRRSMYANIAVSVVTLGLTFLWTETKQLTGVVQAQYAGQLLSLFLNGLIFIRWRQERRQI